MTLCIFRTSDKKECKISFNECNSFSIIIGLITEITLIGYNFGRILFAKSHYFEQNKQFIKEMSEF